MFQQVAAQLTAGVSPLPEFAVELMLLANRTITARTMRMSGLFLFIFLLLYQ
ncbi:MAG TPA: hypothetical protein VKA70_16825 [Blastocatellia bacterium]|nr:hypothetical protein [Blastocatellia bacterium]